MKRRLWWALNKWSSDVNHSGCYATLSGTSLCYIWYDSVCLQVAAPGQLSPQHWRWVRRDCTVGLRPYVLTWGYLCNETVQLIMRSW